MTFIAKALFIIFLIIIILISIRLTYKDRLAFGGVEWDEMIVDTLNITNKLVPNFSHDDIIKVIDYLSQNVKAKLRFVLKDREHEKMTKEQLDELMKCAKRNKTTIYVVVGKAKGMAHSGLGRDDAYMLWLSYKHKIPILSCDKFKDYKELTDTPPFEVHIMNGHKGTHKIKNIDDIILHPPMRLLNFCSDKFLRLRNDFAIATT
ncbi:Uncharacterised protein [uncultured archaeon]|nr:Uncharacterised protein [uncultured archaeon]